MAETQGTQPGEYAVVLVVAQEDERETFTLVLEDMGLKVQAVATGRDALHTLEDCPADLLIMDVQLGDMHGWQFLAKLREIEVLRSLPVIVLTDQPAVIPVGKPIVYLLRPVSIARLKQNIHEVLDTATK